MQAVNIMQSLGKRSFKSLYEMQAYFNTEEKCRQYLADIIWPGGKPVCPHCGNTEKIYKFSNGIHYKCGDCKKRFTVTVKTIFESSKLPLRKWFFAIYLNACHKKGLSSIQLGKDAGVTQATAWFMLQRIRATYEQEDSEDTMLAGTVYCDETFVGGLNKWRKYGKKIKGGQGRSLKGKTAAVLGMLQEGGDLRAAVIDDTKSESVQPNLHKNIKPDSHLISDDWYAYFGMPEYKHDFVDHSKGEYVGENGISTNAIESSWACLKGGLRMYHNNISRRHLPRYVNEFVFRFNTRNWKNEERIFTVLSNAYGKRLTYANLVA